VLRFVPVGSIADIQRCFEFRTGLEGAAAAWPRSAGAGDLAAIGPPTTELETSIRTGPARSGGRRAVHEAVARATRNHYYVSVQVSLQAHIAFGMNLTRNLSLLRRNPGSASCRMNMPRSSQRSRLATLREPAAHGDAHRERARPMFEGAPV
jgi:DNA-binding FadR family transcriptional regulator